MVELENHKSMNPDQEIQASREIKGTSVVRVKNDRLLPSILGTAFFVGFLISGTAVVWGTGPVLAAASWYIPLVSSFYLSLPC